MGNDIALYLAFATIPLEAAPLFQFAKSWKRGTVKEVSPWSLLAVMCIGSIWLWYAITILSWPLVASNLVKLLASSAVLVLYVLASNSKKDVQ